MFDVHKANSFSVVTCLARRLFSRLPSNRFGRGPMGKNAVAGRGVRENGLTWR